jgi:hypothetical protein
MRRYRLGFECGQMDGSFEHGNNASDFIKGEQISWQGK